jgi:hypothetical protein
MRALRMCPVRALHLSPPGSVRHPAGVREVDGEQAAEDIRPSESLPLCPVVHGRHEERELGIGDRARVDPERIHTDSPNRTLIVCGVGEVVIAAHQELASLDTHHGRCNAGTDLARGNEARRCRRGRSAPRAEGMPAGPEQTG